MSYSLRNKAIPDTLRYDIPAHVRKRIYSALTWLAEDKWVGMQQALPATLEFLYKMCQLSNGILQPGDMRVVVHREDQQRYAVAHFFECADEHALDFIEFWFTSPGYSSKQGGVDLVNGIFRQEGIGYEFTSYGDGHPEATKKSSEIMHTAVVMPALNLLASLKFKTANEELLRAHENYRHGKYDDAIVACGRTFETFFKIICNHKGWTYDKDKANLSTLVELCNANSLFPPFYTEIFKNAGTVRNKLGGHGKEPDPQYSVNAEQVDHLIQLISSHILFLAKLSGL